MNIHKYIQPEFLVEQNPASQVSLHHDTIYKQTAHPQASQLDTDIHHQ